MCRGEFRSEFQWRPQKSCPTPVERDRDVVGGRLGLAEANKNKVLQMSFTWSPDWVVAPCSHTKTYTTEVAWLLPAFLGNNRATSTVWSMLGQDEFPLCRFGILSVSDSYLSRNMPKLSSSAVSLFGLEWHSFVSPSMIRRPGSRSVFFLVGHSLVPAAGRKKWDRWT